jgi:phosphatidylinositol-3-phosphatase
MLLNPRRPAAWVAFAAVALAAVGLGVVVGSGHSDSAARPLTRQTPPPHAAPHVAAGAGPVTKVLTVVIENHNLHQMRSGMPYLAEVADTYAYATQYTAIRHPSLPNYLALFGGSTFGVTDDRDPVDHRIAGRSVMGQAVANGHTARAYLEGMTTNCQSEDTGRYAVRHNPWAYFGDERSLCKRLDVPYSSLATDVRSGALPTLGLVVPNTCNDAHKACPLSRADDWLRSWLPAVLTGPDFRSGHLAVVVTADEDDLHLGNKVLTVVAATSLHHRVVTTPITHLSLSGFYSQLAGAAPLRQAAGAPSFAAAFGLRTLSPAVR